MPRKPGYDPVELFLVPRSPAMNFKILAKLLKKELGFRMVMDVILLNATLVKGSHGVRPAGVEDYPIAIAESTVLREGAQMESTVFIRSCADWWWVTARRRWRISRCTTRKFGGRSIDERQGRQLQGSCAAVLDPERPPAAAHADGR